MASISSASRITVIIAAATFSLGSALVAPPLTGDLGAQEVRLVASPIALELQLGDTASFTVRVLGADGAEVPGAAVRYSGPRSGLEVTEGRVIALAVGTFSVSASLVTAAGEDAPELVRIPVVVRWPAVTSVSVAAGAPRLYAGTVVPHEATGFHADGSPRPSDELEVNWSSSDPGVARVNPWGELEGVRPGVVALIAEIDGVRGEIEHEVLPFPGSSLRISGGATEARTGDVLRFDAEVRDAEGRLIPDVPVTWSYTFQPDDSIHAPGAAGIVSDGAFVGQVPGRYSVLALAGPLSSRAPVTVAPRAVVQQVEMIGQGSVQNVHTSDLWVFEGMDGRDYAITGTWGAAGWTYFWDVTDPTNTVKYDSLQIDARTVNDVKVSPDGRYAALSREGASNRRNGVVILDLADPRAPRIASTFDEGLTGGVHNMFATDEYLFALSGGDKYMILDMSDLAAPRFVSEYNHPDSRIHDVWVHDGIAYSSEWGNGVVVVDVGNGRWGGTIENPVFVTNVPYPVGATHAAFPYFQESDGRVYLFLGDEILNRRGLAWEGYGNDNPFDPETGEGGVQGPSQGYIHIIDFTDPENPKDVARYQVPEAGTHNIWVEDDKMYVAYYEGGLRVVDVSGELMGNLFDQGREIAVFKPFDPQGFVVNQPNVWGPQPHKGYVFFSDFNSGIWSVRLLPRGRPVS